MVFSMPFGTPTFKMSLIILPLNRSSWRLRIRITFCGLWIRNSIRIAAKALDTRVGIPTPSTPICNPNTQIAFPAILMAFMTKEAYMETLELPMARYNAAQELYTARNGYDNAESQKYIWAFSMTLFSTLPKIMANRCRLPISAITAIPQTP